MQPEEDAVRLVFADWLEENGEPDRAEFIRVQVELQAMPTECDNAFCDCQLVVCPSCRKWKRLRGREKELERTPAMRAEADRFAALFRLTGKFATDHGFSGGTRDIRWSWSRGFVESVTCSQADFLSHAKELFSAHPICTVRFSDKQPYSTAEGDWFWIHTSEPEPNQNTIADVLWSRPRPSGFSGIRRRRHGFDSSEAAVRALSDECVAYGRNVAKVGAPP